MSFEGNANANVLRGKINNLDVLSLDAYGVAVKNGFVGTVDEWLASLKGAKGEKGDKGESASEENLDAIIAIQQELINNGGAITIDGLPEVTVDDNSKVLQVVNGEWSAEYINGVSADGNLPPVGNEGDVLTVDGNKWVSKPLPETGGGSEKELPDAVNDGEVLTVENKKWVSKPLPEGGGGSATPVNSDWNASKGKDGYVENRTHYLTYSNIVALDNLAVECQKVSDGYTMSVETSFQEFYEEFSLTGGNPLFVAGADYIVKFDDGTYTCKAFYAREGVYDRFIAVGDASLSSGDTYNGEDTDLPFFVVNKNSTQVTIYTKDTAEHTLSIINHYRYAKQLDPNFLPDAVRADKKKAELPYVTVEDKGKVLTVGEDGQWVDADLPESEKELPEVDNSQNGKVLKVVNGAWDISDDAVGGSDSAVSVNADWNANDGEDGYIKNRTHYSVLKTTPWESKSYTTVTTDPNTGAFYRSIHDPTTLPDGTYPVFEVGATYEVVFNGNKPIYCEAFPSHIRGDATNYLAVGNPALTKKPDTYIQEDNGLPFFYVTTMDDGSKAYLYVQNNEAVSITINKVVERYFKQLAPEYLPDNVKLPEATVEDKGKVLAVNDSGVWKATTLETGGGGGQEEFAAVTKADWGTNLQAEKRLHINAEEAIMVNGASFNMDATGYSVITDVTVPENTSPFTVVNKQYVADAISDALSNAGGGGGGGGVTPADYVIEEGVATASVGGSFTYRKWHGGLLEVEGNFLYQNKSCDQMESLYALGNTTVDIIISDTTGPISFTGTPTFCAVSVDGMGTFATCFSRDRNYGNGCVSITYYSIIPDNTFGVYTNLYIRGRWK